MPVTQLVVGLKKQDQNDAAWHTGLNSGMDDANTRLTLAGAGSPEGVTTGHWVGQKYWDTTNKRYFVFNGTPAANTGWVVYSPSGIGTAAERATAYGTPTKGNLWGLSATALKILQMYDGAAWQNIFGYGAGNEAAKPASELVDGFEYLNTDKGHAELRVSGAWADVWPGIKLSKAESLYTGATYSGSMIYVKETAGAVDLNVVVTTPATGSWAILAIGNVVAAGPGGSKAVLQSELHRNAAFVGTRGGSGFPDIPSFNVAAPCFDVFAAALSTAYTYKLRAASQQNNSTSVAAGLYAALVRVN